MDVTSTPLLLRLMSFLKNSMRHLFNLFFKRAVCAICLTCFSRGQYCTKSWSLVFQEGEIQGTVATIFLRGQNFTRSWRLVFPKGKIAQNPCDLFFQEGKIAQDPGDLFFERAKLHETLATVFRKEPKRAAHGPPFLIAASTKLPAVHYTLSVRGLHR